MNTTELLSTIVSNLETHRQDIKDRAFTELAKVTMAIEALTQGTDQPDRANGHAPATKKAALRGRGYGVAGRLLTRYPADDPRSMFSHRLKALFIGTMAGTTYSHEALTEILHQAKLLPRLLKSRGPVVHNVLRHAPGSNTFRRTTMTNGHAAWLRLDVEAERIIAHGKA